jgi:hypothetical protein
MPTNPFTAVVEHNAHYPWKHSPDFFCKCTSCHAYRTRRILSKCDLLATAIDILESDNARLEMPKELPPITYTSLTPTTFRKIQRPSQETSHAR